MASDGPAAALPRLDTPQRRLVAATWMFRANAERSAHQRFQRLRDALEHTRAPAVLIDLASRAIDDEARHAELCDGLAASYGWTGPRPPVPPHHAVGPTSLDDHDRLLYELVCFCCVSETLNASLLVATLDRAREPRIRAVVQELLADEIHHGRLGWGSLQHARDEGRGDFLAAVLPQMLRAVGVAEVFQPDTKARADPRLAPYGELDRPARVAIFYTAMQGVVFPGLERVGVDTTAGRLWLTSLQSAPRRLDCAQPPDPSP